MGRGLGNAQKAALDALAAADADGYGIFVTALADTLGLSARRTHTLVDTLSNRQLVWTRRSGWVKGHDMRPFRSWACSEVEPPRGPGGLWPCPAKCVFLGSSPADSTD